MKFTMGALLLTAGLLTAAPSSYSIKKASGFTPNVDGVLSEWPATHFIDTLKSDNNVFARSSKTPWTMAEFQMCVYAAYDSEWVYYGVRVLNDDVVKLPDSAGAITTGDNLKINQGGQKQGFYISANGRVVLNASCPYVLNSTLKARASRTGYSQTYEFAVKRDQLMPFTNSFRLAVGTEDIDAVNDLCFAAIGVDYTGNKQDWLSNPWDNYNYYPTFSLSDAAIEPPVTSKLTTPTVFWSKAKTDGLEILKGFYVDSTAAKGPKLTRGSVIREGKIITGSLRASAGSQDAGFHIGNGLDGTQGRCSFVWISELANLQGNVTSAKLRGEYRDGWAGNAFCNAGPIALKVGVADFAGNIAMYGSASAVPENAVWYDALNPLGINMGFNENYSTLMVQKNVTIQAPAGRTSGSGYPVLDGKFFEIDVTDQINWILSHTGANKGYYSGQYAIVFLTQAGDGTTGKINLYADETGNGIVETSPWTRSGNSIHLVANIGVVQTVVADSLASKGVKVEIPTTTTVAAPVVTIKPDTSKVVNTSMTKYVSYSIKLDSALAAALNSATITFDYSKMNLTYAKAKDLRVYYLNGTKWDSVGGTVDTAKKVVTCVVTHFSTYGLFAPMGNVNAEDGIVTDSDENLTISPNPSNPSTSIRFVTAVKGAVTLNVYDVHGQKVKTLFSGEMTKGSHSVMFNGVNLSSGIYYVRLMSAGKTFTKMLLLTK